MFFHLLIGTSFVFNCLPVSSCSRNQNEIPRVSGCHIWVNGMESGYVRSHEGYPTTPYPAGYRCRLVIQVPLGRTVEASVSTRTAGLRPWDYAVLVEGSIASQLNFICNVSRYKQLGSNVEDYFALTHKYLASMKTISLKSTTSTVVVDFCADPFSAMNTSRKGFGISYTSTGYDLPGIGLSGMPVGLEDCGKPINLPSSKPNRIVNGVSPETGSWPWICGIADRTKRVPHFCGCSLISDSWVITAGHCVRSYITIPGYLDIYIGVENLLDSTKSNIFQVEKVIVHEKFNHPAPLMDNDVALLKLKRKVTFSEAIRPICLPSLPVREVPYGQRGSNGRRLCYLAGWGTLYFGQIPEKNGGKVGAGTDDLLQVALEIMPQSLCRKYANGANGIVTERQFCAGYDLGWYDTCQGDSGGPLVCDDGSGKWTLHGIVSWGGRCAHPLKASVYTNVLLQKKWILSKVLEHRNDSH